MMLFEDMTGMKKKHVNIDRPCVIGVNNNKSMGGVDLADVMCAL